VRAGLASRLKADGSIASLVGTRVHAGIAPRSSTLPRIVFHVISSTPEHNMAGGAGLRRALVQIDCFALGPAAATALSEAVRASLQGYSSGSWGSTFIQGVSMRNESDGYQEEADDPRIQVHRRILEFDIWYSESVPNPS